MGKDIPIKKKPHKPLHYSPDVWITIQTLLESGQFSTLENVYKHLKKIHPGITLPAISTARKRAGKEGWNKHASDAEIQEKKTQSITELFAEYGMPLEERIRRNVMGITKIDETVGEIAGLLKTAKKKVEEEGITEEVAASIKTVIDGFPRMTQGLKIMLEYLKNSHALCGDNAPEKKHLMGDALKKPARDIDDLTPEEMNKEVERLLRNRQG